jgi:hypothetical protein
MITVIMGNESKGGINRRWEGEKRRYCRVNRTKEHLSLSLPPSLTCAS